MIVNASETIDQDRDILGGTPAFRGTEGGETLGEFLDDFPTVTRETAVAALELANSLLICQLA